VRRSFDLSEEEIETRAKRHPGIRSHLASATCRDGYRRAACAVVEHLLEKDPNETFVKVHEDNSRKITFIPLVQIRLVELEDPEVQPGDKRPFGFADPGSARDAGPAEKVPNLPGIAGAKPLSAPLLTPVAGRQASHSRDRAEPGDRSLVALA
jgi:hypothetical protein